MPRCGMRPAEQFLGQVPTPVRARLGVLRCHRVLLAAESLYLLEDFIQRLSLDELHGIVMHALVLADPVDLHDVRVMQAGRGPCLAPEPFQVSWWRQAVEGEHLEGHVPAQRFLHGLVDHAHAAAAHLP